MNLFESSISLSLSLRHDTNPTYEHKKSRTKKPTTSTTLLSEALKYLVLNKILEVLQPVHVLFALLRNHVLVKETKCSLVDPSNFKIAAECPLEVFIQITENRKRTGEYQRTNKQNQKTVITATS